MALPATQFELQPQTYDDLRAMPEDGHRYELIHGEIVMSPSPKTKHQDVLGELFALVHRFARDSHLGRAYIAPLDVKFSPHNVVQPDLLFVRRENAQIVTIDYVDGAPDLIVEVLSPSNRLQDLVKKAVLYAEYGVPEYWIVDPDSEKVVINIWQNGQYVALADEDGVARSSVLTGLEIRQADIFELPDWMTTNLDETE